MKLTQIRKEKLIMLPQIQLAVTSLSEIEILRSSHR
jgi:hypothetical protein